MRGGTFSAKSINIVLVYTFSNNRTKYRRKPKVCEEIGNLAILIKRPMAFRPYLTIGLAFSVICYVEEIVA